MNKNYFLLMMGGAGSRFGADRPKQFVEVKGRPVFLYILEELNSIKYVDGIVVVCHSSWIDYVEENSKSLKKLIAVVAGGDCRSKSVYNGLKELRKHVDDKDNILIHDATHPHIDKVKLPELIEKVNEFGAATMSTSIFDTCYIKNSEGFAEKIIDRKTISVGASPECFKFGIIFPIYDGASEEELEQMTSAGAILINNGMKMPTVESNLLNLKITYQNDMELFKLLCDTYFYKK